MPGINLALKPDSQLLQSSVTLGTISGGNNFYYKVEYVHNDYCWQIHLYVSNQTSM